MLTKEDAHTFFARLHFMYLLDVMCVGYTSSEEKENIIQKFKHPKNDLN